VRTGGMDDDACRMEGSTVQVDPGQVRSAGGARVRGWRAREGMLRVGPCAAAA